MIITMNSIANIHNYVDKPAKELSWEEFELFTKCIAEAISPYLTVKGCGRECKLVGKSTVEHQLDVYAELNTDTKREGVYIECKHHQERIDKDVIMKVKCIVEDVEELDRGVVISWKGFTPDARTYAEFVHIDLLQLDNLSPSDWENRVNRIKISWPTLIFKPEFCILKSGCAIIPIKEDNPYFPTIIVDGEEYASLVLNDDYIIPSEAGFKAGDKIKRTFVFDDAQIRFSKDSPPRKLDSLDIIGTTSQLLEDTIIDGADYVKYLLKGITSYDKWIITSDGTIVKNSL